MKTIITITMLIAIQFGFAQWEQQGPEFEGGYLEAQLGFDMALDSTGTIIAYSEIGFDNGPITNVGKVKVYQYNEDDDTYTQLGGDLGVETLGSSNAQFGRSVALNADGTILAVCAPYYLATQGATFIYEYSAVSDDWDLIGTIVGGANQYRGFAGNAVSLNNEGNRVAIGANNRAYVFEQNDDGTWSMLTSLARTNHQRVSLNAAGDRLLSINYAGGNGNVYEENEAGLWNAIGGAVGYGFIGEMNAAGDRVVLGRYDVNRATVYELIAGDWLNVGAVEGLADSRFGIGVDINDEGDIITAGGYWGDLGGVTNNGYMAVYEQDGLIWSQIGDDIIGEEAGDEFGVRVVMNSSGNTVSGRAFMAERAGFAEAGFAAVYKNPSMCVITSSNISVDACVTYTTPSGDMTTTESGTYTDIIPNVCGLDSIITIDLDIHELPTVAATVDSEIACLGDEVVFTGSGADSYAWDMDVIDGETYVLMDEGTITFTVTGADEFGCENTATVDVSVNSLPEVAATASETEICLGEETVLTGSGAETYAWDMAVVDGEAFSPAAEGTNAYTVTGTDENGCQNTASIEVFVNGLPEVEGTVDADEICFGGEVTFNGAGAETYAWDLGVVDGEVYTPDASGTTTYTVTGTDENGCSNTATVDVTVSEEITIDYVVTEEVDGGDGAIDITVAGGTSPYAFDWDNDETGDFDDDEDLTGLVAGSYTVVVQDYMGCTGTETILVDGPGAIGDNMFMSLNAFPNPTENMLNINLDGDFTYVVRYMDGSIVTTDIAYNQASVSLEAYATGIYFLTVTKDGTEKILRIVKK